MTSLMIAMTLGFTVFLNIVAYIPYARDAQGTEKEFGFRTISMSHWFLPPHVIEEAIKNHTYAFEGWGATGNDLCLKHGGHVLHA